jgi:hypothetical protein
MTKAEKMQFVLDLTESVRNEWQDKLKAGNVPESWDGHEIRQWLADKFDQERTHLMGDRKRLNSYRNDVLVNNL